ncbi:hypothetical protein NDU88_002670 [Pleurodeles waltl]|uniref:Uncharacterized protein n=1 Tax=Pleurodeles waltl TaxID=8319 RepID=A0AAV7U9X4_PLEWA|nr:hypothetical protein NDU88_002670 [Pleurodeles waltl]
MIFRPSNALAFHVGELHEPHLSTSCRLRHGFTHQRDYVLRTFGIARRVAVQKSTVVLLLPVGSSLKCSQRSLSNFGSLFINQGRSTLLWKSRSIALAEPSEPGIPGSPAICGVSLAVAKAGSIIQRTHWYLQITSLKYKQVCEVVPTQLLIYELS